MRRKLTAQIRSITYAHHIIINTSNLYLGSSNIDENIVVVASNNAQGDDLAGVDDEDGITEPLSPIAIDGSGYSLNVNVKNMTGNNAYLVGWIDANRNGAFEPIEGRVDIIPITQNGNYVYKFDSNQLTHLTAGVSYIRFRLSTDPLTVTDTGGLASDGEVEDYLVMIGAADLGDLPDTSNATATNNYQTDLINNYHYIILILYQVCSLARLHQMLMVMLLNPQIHKETMIMAVFLMMKNH